MSCRNNRGCRYSLLRLRLLQEGTGKVNKRRCYFLFVCLLLLNLLALFLKAVRCLDVSCRTADCHVSGTCLKTKEDYVKPPGMRTASLYVLLLFFFLTCERVKLGEFKFLEEHGTRVRDGMFTLTL